MKKDVSRVFLYATIVLGLAVASLAWDRHERSEAIKNLFHYSYRVTVQDSETGKALNASFESPTISSSAIIPNPMGSMAYEDRSVRISGIGYTPLRYTFTHPGYKSARLTITSDSDFTDEIVIKLVREAGVQEDNKKANKPEMATPRKPSD